MIVWPCLGGNAALAEARRLFCRSHRTGWGAAERAGGLGAYRLRTSGPAGVSSILRQRPCGCGQRAVGPQPNAKKIRRPLGTAWLVLFQTLQIVGWWVCCGGDRELGLSPQPPPFLSGARFWSTSHTGTHFWEVLWTPGLSHPWMRV